MAERRKPKLEKSVRLRNISEPTGGYRWLRRRVEWVTSMQQQYNRREIIHRDEVDLDGSDGGPRLS